MALNIKNQDVETLLDRVVALTGESKTQAVRKALEERQQRLALHFGTQHNTIRLQTFLQEEVWPLIPPDQLGTALTREAEEAILGYGADGV